MNKLDKGRPTLSIKRKPKNLLNLLPKKEQAEPVKPVPGIRKKRKSASFRRWQKNRHQRYRRNTCMAELIRLWPALFNACNVKPLDTGIHSALIDDWMERFPEGKSQEERSSFLRQALGYYTHRPAYLMALAAPDAQRHQLNGKAAGAVSTAHQLSARCRLLAELYRYPETCDLFSGVCGETAGEITFAYFSGLQDDDLNALYLRIVVML